MAVMRKIEAKAKCLVNLMDRMKVGHEDPTRFITDQLDNLFICLRNDIKQPWNDWTLQVAKSTIPNAGRGLFLDGHAPAGRLLCLYSGELWRESDADWLIDQMNAGNEDAKYYLDQLLTGEYTFARVNGDLLDGTPCDKMHDILRQNPLALGYCINHPPKDQIPNLLPLDVPYTLQKENIKHGVTWHRDKSVIDPLMTVFLAMRDIKVGDELFFDYDLDDTEENKERLPEWYHTIDPSVYEDEQ